MRAFGILLALILSLLASSASAQTIISGVVAALYASPGCQLFEPRQCTFFQRLKIDFAGMQVRLENIIYPGLSSYFGLSSKQATF